MPEFSLIGSVPLKFRHNRVGFILRAYFLICIMQYINLTRLHPAYCRLRRKSDHFLSLEESLKPALSPNAGRTHGAGSACIDFSYFLFFECRSI